MVEKRQISILVRNKPEIDTKIVGAYPGENFQSSRKIGLFFCPSTEYTGLVEGTKMRSTHSVAHRSTARHVLKTPVFLFARDKINHQHLTLNHSFLGETIVSNWSICLVHWTTHRKQRSNLLGCAIVVSSWSAHKPSYSRYGEGEVLRKLSNSTAPSSSLSVFSKDSRPMSKVLDLLAMAPECTRSLSRALSVRCDCV